MIRKLTCFLYIFTLCCWIVPFGVSAQTGNLGVSVIGYYLDTVNLGYTLNINAEVTNHDSTPFAGSLNFALSNQNGIITNTSVFDKPPYSGDSIYLGGHQTVPAIFGVNINPQYFTPGPDVVVVWPICTAPVSDSIILSIYVRDPSGINDPGNNSVSYVVTHDKIMFTGTSATLQLEQVRIYDGLGKLAVSVNEVNIREVPTGQLSRGIYLCQFMTNEGVKGSFKFLVQ